ncbi:glutaredoxin family protein [Evansella sp. AB-P1]|uniref:glutaredoxin family protein n=1 Tax=Evansella sp. AB-P1 TaxID=3037653 RepID=UPI00241DE952|nr:glutaredoxin family protein [Evansella sp. AB-P1]MDG5789506.1 glutaredoxin family protein [Evansella sp. AB-P1]
MVDSITVYTSKGCSYCKKVIEILEENEVAFEEKNISLNVDHFKEWKDKEVLGTPATFYKGDSVIGLDKTKLLELVQQVKNN